MCKFKVIPAPHTSVKEELNNNKKRAITENKQNYFIFLHPALPSANLMSGI